MKYLWKKYCVRFSVMYLSALSYIRIRSNVCHINVKLKFFTFPMSSPFYESKYLWATNVKEELKCHFATCVYLAYPFIASMGHD